MTRADQTAGGLEIDDSEALAAAILDELDEPAVLHDETGIIRRANAAALRCCRSGRPQTLGQWFRALLPNAPSLPALVVGRETLTLDLDAYSLPGTAIVGKPLPGGRLWLLRLIGASADEVRNRDTVRQLQEQLLQAEKLASIGQLAAGVAHEINNPIGYVYSNLGTLRDYLSGLTSAIEQLEAVIESKPELRDELASLRRRLDLDYILADVPGLVDESREGISRVRRIVQDLKDFSYAGSGDDWAAVDMQRNLESSINIAWNELKYHTTVVRDYGELPLVECLGAQINQVFLNLLVNAAQAIDGPGTITVRTRLEGDEVCISITDDGPGMPPEVRERIFLPFFTTKAQGQGTGLGLALSQGIVQRHQGRIEVDSEPGRGTTFRVRLPVRQEHGHHTL